MRRCTGLRSRHAHATGDLTESPGSIMFLVRCFCAFHSLHSLHSLQHFHRFQCLGRALSDSNSSINYLHFSVLSAIWGICFSLKANPNGTKNIAFWHTFGTGGSPARYQFVKSRSSPQNVLAQLAQLAQQYQTGDVELRLKQDSRLV